MAQQPITHFDDTSTRHHRAAADDTAIWRMALGPGFAVGPSGSLIALLGRDGRR